MSVSERLFSVAFLSGVDRHPIFAIPQMVETRHVASVRDPGRALPTGAGSRRIIAFWVASAPLVQGTPSKEIGGAERTPLQRRTV
ncbi:MAG: hypothetical protein MUC60_06045 [Oscillatoria sp. Prado101]|jgi:hypothetical protein|nr:hypothetical protein [Oscillatoria sp. Prado101]